MRFSTRIRSISFCACQIGQSLAEEAWEPLQFEQILGPSQPLSCLSFPHWVHFAVDLERWVVWPNPLQLKHLSGFGMKSSTLTFKYPTLISFGRHGWLKVKKKVLVGTICPPFFSVTRRISMTPWSLSSFLISSSDIPDKSLHQITPLDEFSALWIVTCTGLSTKCSVFNKFIAWAVWLHSTRKEPSLNLLIFFRVPAIAWKPFCTAKGDSLFRGRSSLADFINRNLGQVSHVKNCSLSEFVSDSTSVVPTSNLDFFACFRFEAMLCLKCFVTPTTEPHKGIYIASGTPACVHQDSEYKKKNLSRTLIDPSRCLLILRLGLSTTSRLIGSGQPNHPSKRSPGQRDVLAPTGRSQWASQSPGSLPSPTRVAAHGKSAGCLKPFRETFRTRYIVETTNKAEIRLGELNENAESCRENLWKEIQVKGP